jgi:antibiotic biosynthesis monooxygenase (ABM) superfamily enzyme
MKSIPKWKMAVLIWLGIYPTITTLLIFIMPLTTNWPLPLRTLLLTVIAVPLMVFLILPLLQKLLKNWLSN